MLLVNFLVLLLVLPSVQPKSTYKNAENETQKLKKTDVTAISVYLDVMSRDLAQIKGQVEEMRVEMSSVKSQNSVLLGLMKLIGIEHEEMEDESGEGICIMLFIFSYVHNIPPVFIGVMVSILALWAGAPQIDTWSGPSMVIIT